MSNSQHGGAERRRAQRRPILDTFSLFVVIPKKGMHRLKIHDVSDCGVGCDLDIEGESPEGFPLAKGEEVEFHFYLNQTLYLPLKGRVARLSQKDTLRTIGIDLEDKNAAGFKAYLAFIQMLDGIVEAVRFTSG